MPITPVAETSFPVSEAPGSVREPITPGHPTVALIGRIAIAAIFLASGYTKLTDLSGTAQAIDHQGLGAAHTLALIAGLAEVLGGLALVFGLLTRIAAVGLVLFLIPTTLLFHAFWRADGPDQTMQMVNFMKNVAIMGGLLVIAAFGAGSRSLDARLRRARVDRRGSRVVA